MRNDVTSEQSVRQYASEIIEEKDPFERERLLNEVPAWCHNWVKHVVQNHFWKESFAAENKAKRDARQ